MRILVPTVALLLVLGVGSAFAGAQFWNLGAGTSTGITADGKVVSFTQSSNARIWSSQYGAVTLGAGSTAGVTWKGSTLVVAGKTGGVASRWDGSMQGAGSWSTLPQTDGGYNWSPTSVASIASNGTQVMIVGSYDYSSGGQNYFGAVRYKDDGVDQWTTRFGVPSGYHNNSILNGVSEGDITVGRAQFAGSGPTGGARQAIGGAPTVGLGNLCGPPVSTNESAVQAISGDGTRAVGWSTNPSGNYQACYWDGPYTANKLPTAIPMMPGYYWAEATAVSRTGAYVAGAMWLNGDADQEAFIWDAVHGTRNLATVLTQAGISLAGWDNLSNDYADGAAYFAVSGISEDGKWLTGTGVYNGTGTAWVAFIPEPSGFAVLACGLLPLLKFRRRA